MEDKVKDIYSRLTNKQLVNGSSTISPEVFSSVMLDRFHSELLKNGIKWNKQPISLDELISNTGSEKVRHDSQSNKSEDHVTDFKNTTNIGIDIQSIEAFVEVEDPWEDDFYNSKFFDNEIAYCLKKDNPFQSFAGIFAAKEAIFKCSGIALDQIQISHTAEGKPTSKYADISITHDSNFAVAVALNIRRDDLANNLLELKNQMNTFSAPQRDKNEANRSFPFLALLSIILLLTYIFYKEFYL